jgi:hypothetical protein
MCGACATLLGFDDAELAGADAGGDGTTPSEGAPDIVGPADTNAPVGDADLPDNWAHPCLALHAFCDDFDDGGLGQSWDDIFQDAAVVAFDLDASVSPPRSLVVRLPPGDAAVAFPGCLAKTFAGPAAKAHAQVDMRVDQFDNVAQGVNLFSIQLDPAPPGYQAFAWFVQGSQGHFQLREFRLGNDGDASKSTFPFAASFATFVRVELDVDLTQDPLQIALHLDGKSVLEETTPSLALGPATGFDFLVGAIMTTGASTVWRVHYDNALFDLR